MRETWAKQDGLDSFLVHEFLDYLHRLFLVSHYDGVKGVDVGLDGWPVYRQVSVPRMGDKTALNILILSTSFVWLIFP